MFRTIIVLIMLALILLSLANSMEDILSFERAWNTSSAGQLIGALGFKGAVQRKIKSICDAFEHMVFRCSLQIRNELKIFSLNAI